MPEDTKTSMPAQPTTKQLPAMTDRALLEDMAREVRGMRADLGLVSNDLGVLKQRVSIIEGLRSEDTARAAKLSGGVRGLSSAGLEQEAQIASVILWRKSVDDRLADVPTKKDLELTTAAQTTALLQELTKNPIVTKIVYAVGGAIAAYAASKGIHLL